MSRMEPRVALYSHDAMGIGHLRRNLLVAGALAATPLGASVLMIAGVSEASAFALPPRVDLLTLPSLKKESGGGYESRRLGLPPGDVLALRAGAIRATIQAFEPDVFVVDKLPRGVAGELEPTLELLRRPGASPRCRCVLGLRDILDEPRRVREEWARQAYESAVGRYFDAVWVYGDQAVYDPVIEYGFGPMMAAKVRYTGYLERLQPAEDSDVCRPDLVRELGLPEGTRLALCMVGGGEDGALLAEAFAAASLPPDMAGVVLTGPFMPKDVQTRLARLAATNPRLRVLGFVPDPSHLLRQSSCVVTMGGYNSVSEMLSARKRALVVPRVSPRLEQWIRAERLQRLGLLDILHPDALKPESLTRWLSHEAPGPEASAHPIDFSGLTRLPMLVGELLSDRPWEAPRAGGGADLPDQESVAHVAL